MAETNTRWDLPEAQPGGSDSHFSFNPDSDSNSNSNFNLNSNSRSDRLRVLFPIPPSIHLLRPTIYHLLANRKSHRLEPATAGWKPDVIATSPRRSSCSPLFSSSTSTSLLRFSYRTFQWSRFSFRYHHYHRKFRFHFPIFLIVHRLIGSSIHLSIDRSNQNGSLRQTPLSSYHSGRDDLFPLNALPVGAFNVPLRISSGLLIAESNSSCWWRS